MGQDSICSEQQTRIVYKDHWTTGHTSSQTLTLTIFTDAGLRQSSSSSNTITGYRLILGCALGLLAGVQYNCLSYSYSYNKGADSMFEQYHSAE